MIRFGASIFTAVLLMFGMAIPANAAVDVGDNLKLYGDFRYRFEKDFDRTDKDGLGKEGRDRMRFRLRLGFTYAWSDHTEFGGRIRSGKPADQQSPHETIGSDFDSKNFNIDKAYLKYARGSYWTWVGKNSKPFWTQNELFWDDDINPEGIAFNYSLKELIGQDVSVNAGYFVVQDKGTTMGQKASLNHLQVVAKTTIEPADVTLAAGFYNFIAQADSTTADALQTLDFRIVGLSAQAKIKDLPVPVTVGIDYLNNTEDYAVGTQIYGVTVIDGEDTGFVLSLKAGKLKDKGDVLLAYYYASIEQMAVVGVFAQDDWWGGGAGNVFSSTRSNNMSGHEFRAAYAFGKNYNVVARYYIVEEVQAPIENTNKEEASRFRVDFNIKF